MSTIVVLEGFPGVHHIHDSWFSWAVQNADAFVKYVPQIQSLQARLCAFGIYSKAVACCWYLNCLVSVNLMLFSLEFKHNMCDKCKSGSGCIYRNARHCKTIVTIEIRFKF